MKVSKITMLLIFFLCAASLSFAQSILERYEKAEQFLPKNIRKLVQNIYVTPNWIDESSDFWFRSDTDQGYEYRLFDSKKGKSELAFNHQKLAGILAELSDKSVNADSLNLRDLKFIDQQKKISFSLKKKDFLLDLSDYFYSEKEKEKIEKHQSKSKDGKWMVSVKNYNLFLTNTESGEEKALTTDGIEKYEYATPVSWYRMLDLSKEEKYDPEINIQWSPDSKKFVTFKIDRRKIGELYLYQSLPDSGMRAKVWSYERALPGEEAHTYEFYVFDVEKGTQTKLDLPPFESYLSSIWPKWLNDSKEFYFANFSRGYKELSMCLVNANSGALKLLAHNQSETMVEYQMTDCSWFDDQSYFTWTSEETGWNQLYLYDKSGTRIRQLTQGDFVVQAVKHIDSKNGKIYFTAKGREEGRDPYFTHLYCINQDGGDLKLLTPENAEHAIRISPDGKYFVDNYSTIESKPVSVLRRLKDGKLLSKIVESNIEKLLTSGWKFPNAFQVKARDGKTDIYGAIFYPSNFDSTKKYPVIDGTYSGPQAVRTPKSFTRAYRASDVSIAELGFIVVTIDGLGTAWRSKEFHDFSYENLGDIGAEDHIAAIKQLADRYAYIDDTRVGIYGHSAGGYDAAHAILTHPEFYSVAVSSAGNHDHGMAKAWWPEQYMGMPGEHYKKQSNLSLAKNLKGHLLLVHGDMDNNVNPASSMRLAAEFVKHNKDFELLLIPNRNHSLYDHPYFIRKRWDYFVTHLLNEEAPKEYKVKSHY